MALEHGKLTAVGGNARSTMWQFETTDAPRDVLAPGYFADNWEVNHMWPGDGLQITCRAKGSARENPVMVVSGVMSRAAHGTWLFLMTHTPIWPPQATVGSVQAILDAMFGEDAA